MYNLSHTKTGRFTGPFILILVGGYMLKLSWFKWPDFLVDYGRELYVPWQITQGKVLFADINHLYGPFSHYFNALLFQIFGTGLSTLAYFNIVLTLLLASFIYILLKTSFGNFVATIAGIYFLVIFAFSQYSGYANYNFICPYSHEVTYGIFLFFCALLLFKRYVAEPKPIHAALIGFVLGLIFLTKVEIFLAGFVSILFGLAVVFWLLKPSQPQKHLFSLSFFFLLPIIAFLIYFSFHMPVTDAFNAVMASYKNIFVDALTNNIFYLHTSGLDDPYYNMTMMFRYLFAYLFFFGLIGFTSYFFTRSVKRKPVYGAIPIIMALLIVTLFIRFFPIDWLEIARPYPVLILLMLIYLINNLMKKRQDKTYISRHLTFTLLAIFSMLLLLKIILHVRFYNYGFALAMPAAMVMIAFFLYYIPNYVSRRGNKTIAMGFCGLFIFLTLFFYFNATKNWYDLKNYPIADGRDRFFTFNEDILSFGPVMNDTLNYLRQFSSENDTLIVMPEGVMINYLSRRRNPCRYFEFTPNFVEAVGEEKMIHEISLNRPTLIILAKKNTREHGAEFFGEDYALNISSWVAQHYGKVLILGDIILPGHDFGLIITKLME